MKEKLKKYSNVIIEKILEGAKEIGLKELAEKENSKIFAHAVLNIAPAAVVGAAAGLDGDNLDLLEYNHIANRLIHEMK